MVIACLFTVGLVAYLNPVIFDILLYTCMFRNVKPHRNKYRQDLFGFDSATYTQEQVSCWKNSTCKKNRSRFSSPCKHAFLLSTQSNPSATDSTVGYRPLCLHAGCYWIFMSSCTCPSSAHQLDGATNNPAKKCTPNSAGPMRRVPPIFSMQRPCCCTVTCGCCVPIDAACRTVGGVTDAQRLGRPFRPPLLSQRQEDEAIFCITADN